MSVSGVLFSLFFMLFFSLNEVRFAVVEAKGMVVDGNGTGAGKAEMLPLVGAETVAMMNGSMRRRLGSFQICGLCTCCGGGACLASPCCYAINCNIPNRPFGFCSFTPKACNCFGCQL